MTDLLASVILKPVGEMGFDIAVGSAQRYALTHTHMDHYSTPLHYTISDTVHVSILDFALVLGPELALEHFFKFLFITL